MQKYVRAVGSAEHLTKTAFRKNNTWGIRLPDELDQEIMITQNRVNALTARVLDERIRNEIIKLRGMNITSLLVKSAEEAEKAATKATYQLQYVNEILGDLLRRLL